MEHISQIMNENELCLKTLQNENERLNRKLDFIKKAVYEGYYDDVGKYCMTFRSRELARALEKSLDAYEVHIY